MLKPIAIIGIGCRFPQAPNPAAFWRLLCDGIDAITEIPGDRWDISQFYDPDPDVPGKMNARYGGFLNQVDRFDPHPFKISPREAALMDPQQRLLLEVAWEALEDGGQVRSQLAGSRTGVFIGISTNDYSRIESDFATRPQSYDLTGNAVNIAAGRLSYSFNFRGPSLVVDTACSSALVAVHLACQSLWNQEATMAIAGGVNLLLSPIGNLALTKLKALSPDGRCKAFDASANGYVRSEGAGCVVLKPLSQAQADGDPIYATIRGSAINHDGRSKGLTVPYGPAQTTVIRDALTRAQVSPGEINYIEAHGTGTKLGDPIEVMALTEVLKEGRSPDAICALGTVKSNIGHLEAAAGIAGLIKVALSLKHSKIPPSLHFQTANPYIPFERLPLRVQQKVTPWPKTTGLSKAGVSAFGFAGTNAHVVLEAVPAATDNSSDVRDIVGDEAYLLPLSAHTPAALKALVRAYQTLLSDPATEVTLQDLCYTASARRDHHRYRLVVVAQSLGDLRRQLETLDEMDETAITPIKKRDFKDSPETVLASLQTNPSERKALLADLGKLYVQGQAIRWSALFSKDAQVQSLPLYPWQRERFWVEKTPEVSAQLGHPLIGQPIPLALADTVFTAQLSLAQQPWLSGHQVAGLVVLPGAAYLDMALAASSLSEKPASHQLEDISIESAMVLPRSGSRRVQMIVSPKGDFRIVSAPEQGAPNSTEWVQHATGRLSTSPSLTHALTLAQAQASCTEPVDRTAYYQQLRSRGLAYGESFQGLQQISRQDNQALARVQLPAGLSTAGHLLHPVLMDAGFQLLFATLLDQGEETYLPVGLGQLQLFQPVRSPLWIHGSIHPADPDQPVRRADLHLFDEDGQCLAILKDLQVRRIQPEALQRLVHPAWQDWLYQVAWRPQPMTAVEQSAQVQRGHWLLFADTGGVATALCEQLTQQGHTCQLIEAGQTLQLTADRLWQINPRRPEDWSALWETVIRQGLPLKGAVHLWGADSLSDLQEAQHLGVKAGLELVKGLADTLSAAGGKLWFVTRGTQAVAAEPVAQVGAAPLWGLGRTVALERPTVWGGLVDLAAETHGREAEQLLEELLAPEGEAIALRPAPNPTAKLDRYVARLTRANPISAPPLSLASEGTYLITGGLGSLGRQLAQRLIGAGARHLVLMSRRSPSDIDEFSTDPNVTVEVVQADVSNTEDLTRAFAHIAATLPPLRGVFHAAGVLDDGLLGQLTADRFERVLAPKVAGAWNLHQLTQDLPLDYFMLFSSVAAMLGSPGQANYAAANSFLDSLAHHRQGRGLPALSVNWGAWAAGGMADQLGEREQQRLIALGLDAIAPELGFEALTQLLQQDQAQLGVMPVRWSSFVAQSPTIPPLLSEIVSKMEADSAIGTSSDSEIVVALTALPPAERVVQILDYLRQQFRIVLRLSPTYPIDVHAGFFDMGIDSLTSMELRNTLQAALGKPLASTLFFDYPNLEKLSHHLAQTLFPEGDLNSDDEEEVVIASPSPSLTMPTAAFGTPVEALSEEEAEALLLSALETIHY